MTEQAEQFYQTTIRQQSARIDELTNRLLEMQREGYRPREPQGEPPAVQGLPDAVAMAIADRAGTTNSDVGRQLGLYAIARLNMGVDPDVVVKDILNGEEG